jgi:phosphatidylglycerol:prolipoprotein diacylglycerol transferase
MHPNLFAIPGLHWMVHTYGLLLAIAFVCGLAIAAREARRSGLDVGRITDMGVWVLIAGILGAKLLLLVVDWRFYFRNPREMLSILQSGGVFYGGLAGGIAVAWWYAKKYALAGWPTADVLAPGVVLGQAVGRLGCLAAGCCYGKPASVPWAITFTSVEASRQVGTPLDVPLHPTQIYESIACLFILFFLLWLAPRKRFHGQVVLSYVILYSAARFVIEFFRGDTARGLWGTPPWQVSTSQIIAIVAIVGAFWLFPRVRKAQLVSRPAPAPSPAAA